MKKAIALVALLSGLTLSATQGLAQLAREFAVPLTPHIQNTPPEITLTWPVDSTTLKLNLNRRKLGVGSWGMAIRLDSLQSSYRDTTVEIGVAYEYRVVKDFMHGNKNEKVYGYAASGIDIPVNAQRGTVLLIVDNTHADSLALELTRLEKDLVSDGWKVVRTNVLPTTPVTEIKAWIVAEYEKNPEQVRSVFLFGHVPVPYSGDYNPDAHPDHKGAWPADAYYGDIEGEWTDEYVDNSEASRPENRNVPGDGKFDQDQLPGEILLEVGRVDLSNMPAFAMSEQELLRQYLNKNNAFRHGLLTAPKRALIDDNFGAFGGEAFSASAWRNFAALVGYENITQGDWFTTLDTAAYLWAYGCGGGSYQSAGGVGTTSDFAAKGSKAIFTMMFGSYFGDWDVENSFLRAPLATSYGLTNGWAGRPHWHLYAMAVGETIGYGARRTQNNTGEYITNYSFNYAHIALMGDPTLRMDYSVPPPPQVTLQAVGGTVKVSWTAPATLIDGYHVYRAASVNDPFVQLTTEILTEPTYIDLTPFPDTNIYQVRAISKSGGTIGSYYNTSLATQTTIAGIIPADVARATDVKEDLLKVSSRHNQITVSLDLLRSSPVRISICDVTGREVMLIDEGSLPAGAYTYRFEGNMSNSGIYFIRLLAGKTMESEKVMLTGL